MLILWFLPERSNLNICRNIIRGLMAKTQRTRRKEKRFSRKKKCYKQFFNYWALAKPIITAAVLLLCGKGHVK